MSRELTEHTTSLASFIKKAMLCLASLPLIGLNRQIKCVHINGVGDNIQKHAYMMNESEKNYIYNSKLSTFFSESGIY